MTTIKISELAPTGSGLFEDHESFLHELTDEDLGGIEGGLRYTYFVQITKLLKRDRWGKGQTMNTARGNSMNNNTINGRGFNGQTFGNINTIE